MMDEDNDVGFLEIRVGVRGRVEAERLLVGDVRGGHALARVAIAMDETHSKFEERPEQRHLLRRNLTRVRG